MKFLLCLQFWDQDKEKAMRLARFIVDMDPRFRIDTEFVFVARFDCEHDHDTIRYVNRKFRVNWITSSTRWTGWPGGPNAMALDTIEWLAANRPDSGGALLFEPDCVPVRLDWLDVIMADWDRARFASKMIMGAWRPSGGALGHINGNCVIRPNMGRRLAVRSIIGPELAWDCAIAPYTSKDWYISDRIKNCFESRDAKPDDLFSAAAGSDYPALVHGYKDDSAYNLAAQKLLSSHEQPEIPHLT